MSFKMTRQLGVVPNVENYVVCIGHCWVVTIPRIPTPYTHSTRNKFSLSVTTILIQLYWLRLQHNYLWDIGITFGQLCESNCLDGFLAHLFCQKDFCSLRVRIDSNIPNLFLTASTSHYIPFMSVTAYKHI